MEVTFDEVILGFLIERVRAYHPLQQVGGGGIITLLRVVGGQGHQRGVVLDLHVRAQFLAPFRVDAVEEGSPIDACGAGQVLLAGLLVFPVIAGLTQALLESIAKEILEPNSEVVAVYSGFEADVMDSISFIRLDEHLGRLTARDLRQIETSVPLETLKVVVDLAVEIGREGREGKPVGTMFVVGDTRKVISLSHPAGYDPVRGYGRKERSLPDPRVREAIKEVAPLDGAFIVAPDGTVEKACQIVDADHVNLTLSKGLGSRHWAAAAISKSTNAIAVVVSESNGTVRLFKDGEVILRIEPFRRAMKWKDFEYEPPSQAGD